MLKQDQTNTSPLIKKGIDCQIGAISATLIALLSTGVCTFAATELKTAINDICVSIGTLLTNVLSPICILILGIAIFSIIVGKNSKSAETGMDWAKRAIIGFIAFNILGSVLAYGEKMFSGGGTQQWAKAAIIDLFNVFIN